MEQGGVEEGNSLKKHYVTEECVHASVFKGPRLGGEKEGFVGADLAAWQAGGRLSPLSGSSCFMAQFVFHSCGVKVRVLPPGALRRRPIVLKFALFPERTLVAVDTAASPYGGVSLPHASPLCVCSFAIEAGAAAGDRPASPPAPAIHNQTPVLVDYFTGSASEPELLGDGRLGGGGADTREEGIWSHQGESECAQSVGV